MDNRKKVIVTLWIGTTVLLAVFFFLPQKADNYFLSLRVLHNEQKVLAAEAAGQKRPLQFFRGARDDARMLKMLELRARDDGKWLVIFGALAFFILNIMACFLYIFNMRFLPIAAWILLYVFAGSIIVLRSYISISP